MKHAPILPPRDDIDEEPSRFVTSSPAPPGVPTTDDEEEAAVQRSLAAVAAGDVHEGALVEAWIDTIGLADHKPFEEWLAARNG